MNDLKLNIEKAIEKARVEKTQVENIYSGPTKAKANQFLFFIKPEITQNLPQIKLPKILDVIFDKIQEFNLTIQNVKLLGAEYLKKYDIIAQHYGVINQLSRNALQNMGQKAKDKFQDIFKISVDSAEIIGSLQFLEKYPSFNAETLFETWQETQNNKISGGTYIGKMQVDAKDIFVVNGFHPMQLENFVKQGRSIVVFTLTSDVDWSIARTNFIGATNPEGASEGSIRRLLLENMNEFGLPVVDGSKNGVHLSAGPVEALVELIRFGSDLLKNETKAYSDFSFGQLLEKNFSKEKIAAILSNQIVELKGKSISVFDLTEEKNSKESVEILKEANF